MSTTFQGDKVLDVLEALEEAARTPNVHLVDLKEVLDKENWSVYHNVCVSNLNCNQYEHDSH